MGRKIEENVTIVEFMEIKGRRSKINEDNAF